MLEMQKRIADFEYENTDLKNKLKIRETLTLANHAYWITGTDSNDGPFCTRCWDAENKLITLHPNGNPAFYNCPNCKCGSIKAKPELDQPIRASIPRRVNLL